MIQIFNIQHSNANIQCCLFRSVAPSLQGGEENYSFFPASAKCFFAKAIKYVSLVKMLMGKLLDINWFLEALFQPPSGFSTADGIGRTRTPAAAIDPAGS